MYGTNTYRTQQQAQQLQANISRAQQLVQNYDTMIDEYKRLIVYKMYLGLPTIPGRSTLFYQADSQEKIYKAWDKLAAKLEECMRYRHDARLLTGKLIAATRPEGVLVELLSSSLFDDKPMQSNDSILAEQERAYAALNRKFNATKTTLNPVFSQHKLPEGEEFKQKLAEYEARHQKEISEAIQAHSALRGDKSAPKPAATQKRCSVM